MLDMGFEPQIRKLLQGTDANEDDDQQVLMFSATFQKGSYLILTKLVFLKLILCSRFANLPKTSWRMLMFRSKLVVLVARTGISPRE